MGSLGDVAFLHGLAVALGVGLLLGIERERHHSAGESEGEQPAGVRSFALVALAGWLAGLFGVSIVLVALAAVGLLAGLAYWRTSRRDPGLTSEIALLLCCLIGALAVSRPGLAAAVGVLAAALLAAKRRLHRVSRELISETELRDGLLLAAAALVVLPLLPDRALDPLGAFNPATIWRLVVLIMGISALGHLALRLLGVRWGWLLAGFFSGYVSSTAAVLSYAGQAKGRERAAAAAALAANLASVSLVVPLLAALSLSGLRELLWPLLGAALGLFVALLLIQQGLRRQPDEPPSGPESGRMFHPGQALAMALLLSAVLIVASLLQHWLGSAAALLTAVLAGMVEMHSATATLGQLYRAEALSGSELSLGWVAILLLSGGLKATLAFSAGPRAYGAWVATGLACMIVGALGGALLGG